MCDGLIKYLEMFPLICHKNEGNRVSVVSRVSLLCVSLAPSPLCIPLFALSAYFSVFQNPTENDATIQ